MGKEDHFGSNFEAQTWARWREGEVVLACSHLLDHGDSVGSNGSIDLAMNGNYLRTLKRS